MSAGTQLQGMAAVPSAVLPAYKNQIRCALLVMIIIPALCIAGNQAGLLRIVFPVLSLAIGGFLFWRSKPHYVALVCWLWFITPFLGRMAGYQGGWTPSNPVLVAPYIATGLSGFTLVTSVTRLADRKALPYACALIAILYGLIIGILRYPLFNVLQALLNWIVPVVFGFFIYEHRRFYPEFRKAIEKSFLFGVLLMGAYGIYQFFELPDWDRKWMLNTDAQSFGTAEAMGIRVFSTMNAPPVFAAVTACGLLILLNLRGRLPLLSVACGFIALMFTISRASWISLVVGGIYLVAKLGTRQRARLATAAAACVLVMLALSRIPEVGDLLGERIDSFSAPGQDVSYSSRIEGHRDAIRTLAQEPFGEGLGSTDTDHFTVGGDSIIGPHDSTLLEFLYSLGWIGTMIYVLGLGSLVFQLVRTRGKDSFVLSSKAILIGLVVQCLLNSILLGVMGFMVWTFASMCLAEAYRTETASEVVRSGALQPANSYAMA